jgi:hypothetical protein
MKPSARLKAGGERPKAEGENDVGRERWSDEDCCCVGSGFRDTGKRDWREGEGWKCRAGERSFAEGCVESGVWVWVLSVGGRGW